MNNIPEHLKEGIRTILLIRRKKNGGHNRPHYHAIKCITRNSKEFDEQVIYMRERRKTMDEPDAYRIYSSVNSRNIDKAIHHFKIEQIITDTYEQGLRHQFYIDILNRFFGVLMEPKCSAQKNFLWDIDTEEGDDLGEFVKTLAENAFILHQYPTPHGFHIITEPFNYTTLPRHISSKMKKDALMFIE